MTTTMKFQCSYRWFCSMVVRRAVKLAHIVCAVFSLSRPRGVTRSQIYKFCSLNFNIRKDRRQFNHALQRAEDEDLVTCFQQRYRLGTSGGTEILWSNRFRRYQGRQRKRPRAGAKMPGTRMCKKRLEVKRTCLRRAIKDSLDNLENRRREVEVRRKCKKDMSRLRCAKKKNSKDVILRKPITFGGRRNVTDKISVHRRSSRIKNKKEVEMVKLKRGKKSNVRSKREHRRKIKVFKNSKHLRRQRKKVNSLKSKKPCKARSRRDVYRDALRRPTRTVAHAESWDRINYSRRRSERENQELTEDSKMVQRILSVRHGPSWDDLNKKLRRIKSGRSCEVTVGKKPSRISKSRG